MHVVAIFVGDLLCIREEQNLGLSRPGDRCKDGSFEQNKGFHDPSTRLLGAF